MTSRSFFTSTTGSPVILPDVRSLVPFIFFHFLRLPFYLSFPHSLSVSRFSSTLPTQFFTPLTVVICIFPSRLVFILARVDNMEIENVDLLNKPLSPSAYLLSCLQVDKMSLIISVLTNAIYHLRLVK